jgi:hypothetical protein
MTFRVSETVRDSGVQREQQARDQGCLSQADLMAAGSERPSPGARILRRSAPDAGISGPWLA